MKLTAEQIELFNSEGYLFFPKLFSKEEVVVLEAAIPDITKPGRPSRTLEDSSDAVRMVKGMHLYNETLYRLTRHPRVVRPSEQLLNSSVYTLQTRLNMKSGLDTEPFKGYPWHQDYSTYHRLDGMPEPRALVIAVFLDEVTPCNAPLMFIPKSHRFGMITQAQDEIPEDPYLQLVIHNDAIRQMVRENGLVAQLGPAGSVLFLHVAMVHASTQNISPLRRAFYYLIYNSTENACQRLERPEYEISSDCAPLTPLTDDCLLRAADETFRMKRSPMTIRFYGD